MMNNQKKTKKKYVAPKIERLGKLNTLIQGTSGKFKDTFPTEGVKKV